jgi:hypothetical protein
MMVVNYSVQVAKKTFSAGTGSFNPGPPVVNATLPMQMQNPTDGTMTFTFDGFSMKVEAFLGQNAQVTYTLTKPGHPLNGNFSVGFGIILLDPGQGSTTVFRQLDIEINVSLTEKYRVTMNKV